MASGEHVVEDLFGFAELTGEATAPSIDKKSDDSQKFHFEKEKIKRDTNEVVVPIFFEKSGVKKYKVLARHQVEDDEDIKRPDSSERKSPNSEEQRKENICVDRRSEKSQKYKSEAIGNVKKTKVRKIEKRKDGLIKDFKHSLNTSKLKGELSKIHQVKCDGSRNKTDKQKDKKVESSGDKERKTVNYEFNEDSESSSELQRKSSVEDKVDNENCNTSCTRKNEDVSNDTNLEKQEVVQNPLKIKCHVKLRRDPSIENFYKIKPESDSKDSADPDLSDRSPKTDEESDIKSKCLDSTSSYELKPLCRQNSSEDILTKAADMVYNVDIQVRKSGRLQSAKCASRYRGDYGIRVDTYKQLINKTATSSNNSFETDEKQLGNSEGSELLAENNIESHNQVVIQNNDSHSEKTLEIYNRSDKEGVISEQTENQTGSVYYLRNEYAKSKQDEAVLDNEKRNIETEHNNKSENFTVIKKSVTDHCLTSEKNGCIHTDVVPDSFIKIFDDKGNKIHQEESGLKHVTERVLLSDRNKFSEIGNETNEILNKTYELVAERQLETQISDLKINSSKETSDNCRCEVIETRETNIAQYDSKVIQAECSEVASKVPCSNMLEGSKLCACDNRLNDLSQCVNDVHDEICIDNVKCETKYEDITSQKTDMVEKHSGESKNSWNTTGNVESVESIQIKSKYSDWGHSQYVHSVGKSVNKMQNRIKGKKPVVDLNSELTEKDISPECSPVKDPAKILECLRQRLFESAGANLVEADKATKQFESKLISSKQRQSVTDSNVIENVNPQDRDRQARDSDSASTKSGKSTPRCTTPRQEVGHEILEEVAKSLNVLHQAKRRSEIVSKNVPTKRPRFEEKKFMLRSMIRTSDNIDSVETPQLKPDILIADNNCNEKPVFVGRIAERTRSSRNSGEGNGCSKEISKQKVECHHKANDTNILKRDIEQDKINPKIKPVKCSACGHIFKTKELLRKHFPCRIRQTRTWSQNKLRPNRAVKRNENGSKKFVCKLPKTSKPEPNKSRPQLLTYRKTKFRRVKGKRRRKLYQLIQELMQKRNPAKWHHLSILYDDLSFKEQCLYKLGLICIGNAAEGLERYTAEDITVFEQHRAKEKWLTEDARTFVHSIPDTLEPLTDLNVSTEISTDTQESDFFSPKHVINSSQENQSTICDNVKTQEEKDGARNLSDDNTVENGLKELTCTSQSESRDKNEPHRAPCFMEYPGIEEQAAETSFEMIEEIETPGTLNANVSFQECHEVFRSLIPHMDVQNDTEGKNNDKLIFAEEIRSLKEVRLETFTPVAESNKYLEVVKELSPDAAELITLKDSTVENSFKKADISEIVIKDTYEIDANKTNASDSLTDNSQDEKTFCQQTLMDKISEGESVKTKENIEERVLENKDKMSREPLSETKDMQMNTQQSNEELVPLSDSVSDTKKNKSMKKVLPRNKCLTVPDIELYHQTANLDDQLLATTSFTVQGEKATDNEIIKSSSTASRCPEDINSDIFLQASGILNDIIGNIEQRTNNDKDKITPEIEKLDKVDKNTLKTLDISPVKGILKNTCSKKKFESEAPQKQNSELTLKEHTEKSPKKKKIDFKTYAKRKGLIKDNDTKNKESVQEEFHHQEIKVNDSREEIDKNDKECMRSEPSLEIEDGLLGRLLDAVNLIDSIIEEHKEEIDLEENADTFNAITPEMAFEALVANEKPADNTLENFVSKPYDIESEYPYTEVHEKDLKEETLCFTEISEISKCDFDELTDLDRNPAYLISDKSISPSTEDNKDEDLPDVYPATIGDIDQNIETSPQNGSSDADHVMRDNEILMEDNYGEEDLDELGKKFCKVDFKNLEVPESEIMIKEPKINKIVSSIERLDDIMCQIKTTDDIMCQIKTTEKESEKCDVKESSVKGKEIEFNQLNPEQDVVQNTTNSNQPLLEKEMQNVVSEKPDVKNTYSKEKVHECIDIEKTEKFNSYENMKSPEHIPKKVLKKINENTAIKESKRDFTIKYEMNGIVVKENLLTGDKNVVENSSPFRSSAESESNCDQSSFSELDVSSNYDNEVNFENNLVSAEDSLVKDTLKTSFKADSSSVTEKETGQDSTNIDCQIPSTEEVCFDEKQLNEHLNHLEEPRKNLSLDMHSEENVPEESDARFDKEDHGVIEEITTDIVALPVENVPDMQPHLNDIEHIVQDVSTENVINEPFVDEMSKFTKKIFDDSSVGSPPVLEKVEVSEESIDEQDDITSSPGTELSIEGEPPLLELEQFEKDNSEKLITSESHHLEDKTKELSDINKSDVKQDKIVRQERHFLDILSIVGTEAKDSNVFASFGNKSEVNGIQQSDKTHKDELYKEDSTSNEDIGRHFSDVMSEPIETPKSPKSKLQFLFDNNESSDISLAQIKDVLSPFSVKGKKKSISKESLLKIKSSIADLLLNAEKPAQNDLKLLSDFPSDKTENNYTQKSLGSEVDNGETESLRDECSSKVVDVALDSSEAEQLNIDLEFTTKSSIADHILQMLNSLEDKGNIAENMSSLLGILAENLGFLGKRKVEDLSSDSDSDYSYSEDTNLTGNSSTENTQKELIAEYLEEGEQPPSLDDIPTASNLEVGDEINCIKDNEEDSVKAILVQEQIGDKHVMGKRDSFADRSKQECERTTEKKIFSLIESEKEIQVIDSYTHMNETKMEDILKDGLHFESSDDSLSFSCDHTQGEKHKATTIFKSITELNSIETDEESVTDEPFDPVTMSARLSDLKVLPKDNNRWEFNSDYNSDDDKLDYYDSDYENETETQTDVVDECNDKIKANTNEEDESEHKDIILKQSTDIFESQNICRVKDGRDALDAEIPTNDRISSDQLTQVCVISKDSTKLDAKLNDIKTVKSTDNLSPIISKTEETIEDFPQSSAKVSQADTDYDDESDSQSLDKMDSATLNTLKLSENENEKSVPKVIASELTPTKYRVDNIFTSFEKDIKKSSVSCSDIGQQEQVIDYTDDLNDTENIDCQSLKAEIDPFSDNEKDLSEDESWENDISQGDSVTIDPRIGSSDNTVEGTDKNMNGTTFLIKESDHLTSDKNTSEFSEDGDLKLILEVDPLNESPASSKEGSIDLQTNLSTDENEYNQKQTTSFNDLLLYKVDEDTTETVKYGENVNTETDTCDNTFEEGRDKELTDSVKDPKTFCTVENDNISDPSQVDSVEKNVTEVNGISSDNMSSLINKNGSEDYRQDFEKTNAFIYQQNTVSDEEEHTSKRRSTSLNIHDDYSDNFCESIAEKVKRKQRERSKSVCYSFNPWLYYSAAYVREVTKPARKEFSVFRSSILEKRAREKSFSPDKDFDSTSRKKRNSSVPKEAKYSTIPKSDRSKEKRMFPAQQPDFQIKPCSVLIPKLKEDVILKYTKRKRKCEEDETESRPPIKVTIKLSQILYPPPNSPYGSTSTSSDNYRSGYESCSEESETESLYETDHEKELVPGFTTDENLQDIHVDNDRPKTAEVISSEPLKIKIRTLRNKNDVEHQKSFDSVLKNDKVEHVLESLNDSSNKANLKTSSDGLNKTLAESEVDLDIEKKCEKMKDSKSVEDNVMFYLSESDSDNEQKSSEYKKLENVGKEKQSMFVPKVLSKSSIMAECGESDVDLSDSDTDSEIQEAIDKILNSKSSSDFSGELVKDAENSKQSTLKKGNGSGMKMIVSHLRLSESESESECENTDGKITDKGKDTMEKYQPKETDFSQKYTLSQQCDVSLPNTTERSMLVEIKDEHIDKQKTEISKIQFQESSNLDVTEKCFETKITQKEETKSCHLSDIDTIPEEKDSGVLAPGNVIASNEITLPLKQNDVECPAVDVSSLIPMGESHKLSEKAENVLESLDLSVFPKNNEQKSSSEEEKEEMDVTEKSYFLNEKHVRPHTDFKSTDINLYSDNQNSRKRAWTPVETLNETERFNATDGESKKLKLCDARKDLSVNDLANTGRSDCNFKETKHEFTVSDNRDSIDESYQQKSGVVQEVSIEIKPVSDLKNVSDDDNEQIDSKRDYKNVDIDCQESTDSENGSKLNMSEDVSKSPEAFIEVRQKTEISEEDSKQLENVSAVKNLEEDVFQDIHQIHNATEDDMIYYAVELSDDLETSEAVVNLETVELIEGPIIVENNETLEENVIDTNIIQSHVNDHFEISTETLNEHIVEVLNEPKISDETRINCALENMPQMENATVNNTNSKYLYGINEDSQSSTEVVEELVTEIVNDNTVLEIGHDSAENQQPFPTESTSWEIFNSNNHFLDAVQQESENSLLVSGNERSEVTVVIPTCVENEEVASESAAADQLSGNGLEGIQNAKVVNDKSNKLGNVGHIPKPFRTNIDERLINETSVDNSMISDKAVMRTDYINLVTEDSSNCNHFIDNYTSPLNISADCTDTRDMCSQQKGFVQLKSDNLSHGNDLISVELCENERSDNDQNKICVEPSQGKEEDQCSGINDSNNILQEVTNDGHSGMIVECSEDNDYIITQNVSNDDEDDNEDGDGNTDAMEIL